MEASKLSFSWPRLATRTSYTGKRQEYTFELLAGDNHATKKLSFEPSNQSNAIIFRELFDVF